MLYGARAEWWQADKLSDGGIEMLELKVGQRGIYFLVYVGFCGEFPISEYYEPHESQYKVRPYDGYFFDFQMDAVKSFCNTGAELISVPGTLLHEK